MDATERMLGFLFTNWSDGNGQRLLDALKAAEAGTQEPAANTENPERVTPPATRRNDPGGREGVEQSFRYQAVNGDFGNAG